MCIIKIQNRNDTCNTGIRVNKRQINRPLREAEQHYSVASLPFCFCDLRQAAVENDTILTYVKIRSKIREEIHKMPMSPKEMIKLLKQNESHLKKGMEQAILKQAGLK